MVSMLGSNVIDCGFYPRSATSSQRFPNRYLLFLSKVHSIKGKDPILVMFPNGATCLSVDCCVNMLAL